MLSRLLGLTVALALAAGIGGCASRTSQTTQLPVALSAHQGEVLILDFWAVW